MKIKIILVILVLSLFCNGFLFFKKIELDKELNIDITEINIAWQYAYRLEYYGHIQKGNFDKYRERELEKETI